MLITVALLLFKLGDKKELDKEVEVVSFHGVPYWVSTDNILILI